MVIETEYSYALVKLNQIQSIEMVNHDSGGILTITLKGDKTDDITYSEDNQEKWDISVKWLKDNTINLSSEIGRKDVLRHKDEHPGF